VKTPAVVFAGPGRVEIREMAVPEPGPGQVGVRTVFSGVSQGTERWALTGRYDQFAANPAATYPCSPGYQASGVVDVVGSGITDLREGERVFLSGTQFLDPGHRYPGPCMASHSGYLVAARADVTPVPPDADMAGAALYHMAGVSRHGVRLSKVGPGDYVAVIGLGMIGQMSAQAARRAGARVIGTDLIASRVQAAAEYSADVVVDARSDRLEDVIAAKKPGGADVVIDTTGDHRIFDRCLGLIRREGRVVMQGYYPEPISINFHRTHIQRPTVTFPCGWDDQYNTELADDMATGAVVIAPLITHRIPFESAPSAYDLVLEHPERSLGMVFSWGSEEAGAASKNTSARRD
jgi:2-desacetyl-2-hydroxyethyl bacteriochlorophyllide A dehydrogenase